MEWRAASRAGTRATSRRRSRSTRGRSARSSTASATPSRPGPRSPSRPAPEAAAPWPETLHPLQAAFVEQHGLQCGFCTPGMVMTALDLIEREPDPTDDQIREALEGNLCRCTGYQSIVDSVRAGAAAMRAETAAPAEAAR